MAINFEQALGVHPNTLAFRTQRAKVLAGNLANVDTPNYKARDISFEDAMAHVANEARAKHLERRRTALPQRYELLYRNPNQPSQDGNTVELGVEQAKFAENAMAFETSTTFLNMKLNGLKKAINGQ
ncbi:Flagellar basal-body rod protein FlgB [Photobacterium marinum]|uniref:Flagellar basal body rod protein FlgB n=1 Tax=Photobacterium marinum TaxID=1056511 RepID=L8JDZ0_9GAMM|nr:flagellar basal body rod protein FlgB [Photobacterium marinum]ELR67071.1 Flagellar basal-body rod protein FlgB [Photobacterium marinum]